MKYVHVKPKHSPLSHFLCDTKQLHVKLQMPVYMEFKKLLAEKNLNMTWAVEEFVIRYVNGDKRARSIIDNLVKDRLEKELNAEKKQAQGLSIDEIDHDTLYRLISGEEDKEDENF